MGDFYSNLNKGIEGIIPLALKKFQIDQDEARWQAENKMKTDLFDMKKQEFIRELTEKKAMTDFGNKLTSDIALRETLGPKLQGLQEQQSAQGGGPDIDPQEMMARIGGRDKDISALIPQMQGVEQRLNPKRVILDLAAANPEKGMTGIMSLLKDETSKELLTEKLGNMVKIQGMRGDMSDRLNDAKFQMLLANIAGKKELQEGKDTRKLSDAEKIKARILEKDIDRMNKELMLEATALGPEPRFFDGKWKKAKKRITDMQQAIADREDELDTILYGGRQAGPAKAGPAQAGPYKSADDVKAAFQGGKISKEEALNELRKNYGMK